MPMSKNGASVCVRKCDKVQIAAIAHREGRPMAQVFHDAMSQYIKERERRNLRETLPDIGTAPGLSEDPAPAYQPAPKADSAQETIVTLALQLAALALSQSQAAR